MVNSIFSCRQNKAFRDAKSPIFPIQWDFSKGISFQHCFCIILIIWYLFAVIYSLCNGYKQQGIDRQLFTSGKQKRKCWVSWRYSILRRSYAFKKIFGIVKRFLWGYVVLHYLSYLQVCSHSKSHHEKLREFFVDVISVKLLHSLTLLLYCLPETNMRLL